MAKLLFVWIDLVASIAAEPMGTRVLGPSNIYDDIERKCSALSYCRIGQAVRRAKCAAATEVDAFLSVLDERWLRRIWQHSVCIATNIPVERLKDNSVPRFVSSQPARPVSVVGTMEWGSDIAIVGSRGRRIRPKLIATDASHAAISLRLEEDLPIAIRAVSGRESTDGILY